MTARSTSRAAAVGSAAAAAIAVAVATTVFASPSVFAADPASGAAAASAPGAASAATQFTVKPGQSLNDVAIAVTQSHDRAVLSRASKAIFDANPSAFMRGDPSLMKLGAVLNVPPLDSTGAIAQAPSAAPSPASAAAASAAHGATLASSARAASEAGASASVRGEHPEGSSVAGASATANVASAPGSAASPAVAPQSAVQSPKGAVLASAPVATAGGGDHAWTGAIQQAPSASVASATSAAGASGAAVSTPGSVPSSAAAAAAVSGGASASAARPHTFSSLQQLLAFKNRVLMDLQRHGFGSKGSHESGGSAASVSGASAVVPSQAPKQAGPSAAPAPRALQQSGERFIGIGGYGVSVSRALVPTIAAVASAIVAALLVLIVALAMSARKRRAAARAIPASATAPEAAPGADAAVEREPAPAHAEGPRDPIEAEYLSVLARTPASKRALMGLAGHYAERGNVRGFDEIAQRIIHLSGGRGPNWLHIAALGRQLDPDNPLYAIPGEQAEGTFDESVAGEDVLPRHSEQAQSEAAAEHDAEARRSGMHAAEASAASPLSATQEVRPQANAAAEEPVERHEDDTTARASVAGEPEAAPSTPEAVGPRAGQDTPAGIREPRFPAEAIAALNDLDLGLPPRVDTAPDSEQRPARHEEPIADADVGEKAEPGSMAEPDDARGLEVGPVLEPKDAQREISAHDAGFGHEPATAGPIEPTQELESKHEPAPAGEPEIAHESEPRHAPEIAREPGPEHKAEPEHEPEPAHEPAAPPAVAGLGAARFGPLKLAFDLDLPADDQPGGAASTPPQPAFTHEEMAKIARNKLELAAEYIELGDLGGARTLIHEVIDSNDPATRDEARTLLATLAPLS